MVVRNLIQFSTDYIENIFLNWLRTSCAVSIITVSTWHTWNSGGLCVKTRSSVVAERPRVASCH